MKKSLCMYRSVNMDSYICSIILGRMFDGALDKIDINYNHFIKPDHGNYETIYVVGINLSPANKSYLELLPTTVKYFEQSEEKGAILQLLDELNITRSKSFEFVDAYQKGDKETFQTDPIKFNYGLNWAKNSHANIFKIFDDENTFEQLFEKGKVIYEFKLQEHDSDNKRFVRSIQFKGRTALIANCLNSEVFQFTVNVYQYDLFINYTRNKQGYINVKLTSNNDDVDVRDIAKEYGGDGPSKNVAGFRCNQLPEEITFQTHK